MREYCRRYFYTRWCDEDSPDNTRTTITLSSTTQDVNLLPGRILPDGSGSGVLATWTIAPSVPPQPTRSYQAAHVVSGAVTATYDLPFTPTSVTFGQYPSFVLGENGVVYATDGSDTTSGAQVVSMALDTGAVNWSYRASTMQSTLSILAATSDGGVVINDSHVGIVKLTSTGVPAQLGLSGDNLTYSWMGDWYFKGAAAASEIALPFGPDVAALWGTPTGDPSGAGFVAALCGCLVQSTDATQADAVVRTHQSVDVASEVATLKSFQPAIASNCPICNLPAPNPPATSVSCTSPVGAGPTFVLLVGDPGINNVSNGRNHDVGDLFNLAAQTQQMRYKRREEG